MPLTPNEIKEKLLGALDGDYNILNEDVVVEVIGILERFPITKEDLELTRIGKHVNELRRKTANQDLCRRSKNLVRSWQKLVLNDVSASSSPAASSPRLPPRPSGNALPGPRTSSPLVSVSGSPAGSQPRSPAGLQPRGSMMSISTSPLVRTPASPAQPLKVIPTSMTHSGSRPVQPAGVPAVVALRGPSRLASPATSSGEKALMGAVGAPSVGRKNISSPATSRQPASASSSPALRPPAGALPVVGVPPPASPRLSSVPSASRLESATTANYSRTATPPSGSSGFRQASLDKPSTIRASSSLQASTAAPRPTQKADATLPAQRNGTASDGRMRIAPYGGSAAAASVSPAGSTHSVGTPQRPSHHFQSGDSHTPAAAAVGPKHPAGDRANGDATIERTAMSKTNAANKKRRRSDDSIGSSSTSSAPPPRKLPMLNGDAGTATPGHASVALLKTATAQERRPSKVKTTAQLIAELQASKGGDGLLKSDTISRIVSNQIERERYVEHESVVPASAKPRPRKKPGMSSAFTKPPDTPDNASLAKTKSEMVQKYLSSSLLANSGNGGEDSQMTFASSSPSTVGAPGFSVPDNAADHDEDDDEDGFIDIEGLDTASTPDGQRPSQATGVLRPTSTGAATPVPGSSQIKGRAALPDDPYSLLPPLNVDEIVWSEDDDYPGCGGDGPTNSCDDRAVDRLHDARWPGVNGVFTDGQDKWHDWTETIVHGNETGGTLFILPYVDVGD